MKEGSVQLRIATVGCGRMGRRRATAAGTAPGCAIVRVVDADVQRAEALGREVKAPASSDPKDACESDDVDVVFVSTPNSSHATLALSALAHGKHVFVEKPLTTNVVEARKMVAEAGNRGLQLGTGSNVRFFENVEKARELLRSKEIGEVLFARGWIGHEGWVLAGNSWSNEPAVVGGGTLMDNGCHFIDITRWLLGDVRRAQGSTFRRLHKLPQPLEDNFMGIITLDGEVPVSLQSSWTEWAGYFYLEIYGSAGRLIIDSRGDASSVTVAPRSGPPVIHDFSSAPKVSFKRETEDFLTRVRGGTGKGATGADGLHTIEVIQALYEASREKRTVELPAAASAPTNPILQVQHPRP